MPEVNRQWIFAKRPEGALSPDCFEYREGPKPGSELPPNRLLVRNRHVQHAPVMRNWMGASRSGLPSMPVGQPVMAPSISEVIASTDARFAVGQRLFTMAGWQDFAVIDTSNPAARLRTAPDYATDAECLGVYGDNPLTAYFGIKKVGELRAGETLVVSAAAGSTGAWAAQIGKQLGARVIGIAGGPDKCRWLIEACHLDAAIDYKSESIRDRLAELCPKGVDVYFDNVGGEILQAVIDNIALNGRIVLCGQISGYDTGDDVVAGPKDMMRMIYRRVRMQGFTGMGWPDEVPAAQSEIRGWIEQGLIAHREDVREGFASLPVTYLSLFEGTNNGTLISRI